MGVSQRKTVHISETARDSSDMA